MDLWSDTIGPDLPSEAEPGIPEPVRAAGAVAILFPEQRQRHVRPPQFAVHRRPVGQRPLFRRHHRRRGVFEFFSLLHRRISLAGWHAAVAKPIVI